MTIPKCSLKVLYRLIILFLMLLGLEGLPEEKKQAIKEVVPLDVVTHEVVLDYTYWPVGKSGTYTSERPPFLSRCLHGL